MPVYEIQANGKTFEVEAPSIEAAAQAAQGMGGPPSTPPPTSATIGMLQQSTAAGEPKTGRYVDPELMATLESMDSRTVMDKAPFMPNLIGLAGKVPGVVGRAATFTGKALENPLVGAGLGAASGYKSGGVQGALIGGALGASSNTARLGRALKKVGGQLGSPSAAQPAAVTPVQSALAKEMLKREPNWRTTDAVPIDAIKRDVINGGTIIEAGESQPGLATRLADLLKKPTPSQLAEAERLAKALRQRGHIQGRQGQ